MQIEILKCAFWSQHVEGNILKPKQWSKMIEIKISKLSIVNIEVELINWNFENVEVGTIQLKDCNLVLKSKYENEQMKIANI